MIVIVIVQYTQKKEFNFPALEMVLCVFLSLAGIRENTNRTYLANKRKKQAAKNKADTAELNSPAKQNIRKKPSR